MPQNKGVGFATLFGAQLAVGAAAIFARFALQGAQPLAVSALRLLIASAILLAASGVRRGTGGVEAAVSGRKQLLLLAAGIALALHFAGWIWSLQYTSVAVSTLLVTTTPIWTSLYDAIFRGRRWSGLVWAAYAAGIAGVFMIAGFGGAAPPIPGHGVLGAALALIGGIAVGAYFIIVREVRAALSTRAIVTRTYSWAACALVIAALIARQPPPPFSATNAWLGIFAMALISQLLGHTALNVSLRWFSPSAIAMATLLEPILAALLALAVFHEALSATAIAGAVILLAAIAVVLREDQQAEPAVSP